jgi:hypothetical protein
MAQLHALFVKERRGHQLAGSPRLEDALYRISRRIDENHKGHKGNYKKRWDEK